MNRPLASLMALATAAMTALVLGNIAFDQGVPVGAVRISALSVAGPILGALAVGARVKRRK